MNVSISGFDMKEGIRRTGGNAQIYLRFLKRFPDDPTFHLLTAAFERKHFQEAYVHAHTLKGLCAQLGITALISPAEHICTLLKSCDSASLSMAKKVLDEMTLLYTAIVRKIAALP